MHDYMKLIESNQHAAIGMHKDVEVIKDILQKYNIKNPPNYVILLMKVQGFSRSDIIQRFRSFDSKKREKSKRESPPPPPSHPSTEKNKEIKRAESQWTIEKPPLQNDQSSSTDVPPTPPAPTPPVNEKVNITTNAQVGQQQKLTLPAGTPPSWAPPYSYPLGASFYGGGPPPFYVPSGYPFLPPAQPYFQVQPIKPTITVPSETETLATNVPDIKTVPTGTDARSTKASTVARERSPLTVLDKALDTAASNKKVSETARDRLPRTRSSDLDRSKGRKNRSL